ncbi:HNH endonuclease [Eubacterium sp.]|uniref:HNH endonuclease n=1 Tax=Eubacterium sp. TaxID=142586 RepID=UPI0026DEBFA4|nr:HNH endonuclease [Eubacterium sp.]MDO5433334.1 HNH endonuclease [Eubacterium sp.]
MEIRRLADKEIAFVKACIANNDMHAFYTWGLWKAVRREALKLDKRECQHCKEKGRYTKASTVHHVNHVKNCPELALSIWYQDPQGKIKRNLVSLCHDCHEAAHGYRKKKEKKIFTDEWIEDPPSK